MVITYRQARREEGAEGGHCAGARGSELSGLECKIHQLKLRPADLMMFFYFGPKFDGRYDLI